MALVDVIIPSYNYGRFLQESINSVLGQTFQDFNLFIIDDGSTDNTKEVVSRYQSLHSNIQYFFQENRGLPAARNAGLKLSTAPFIAFLDADDVWMPEKLEETLKPFYAQPNLGVVYTLVEMMNGWGNHLVQERPCTPVRGEVFHQLLFNNSIAGSSSSVLVRKECVKKVGSFDESLPSCEDWDLWLRIARYFPFDYIAKPLVKIRIHEKNMHKDVERMVRGKLALMEKVFREDSLELAPLRSAAFATIYLTVSRQYMDIGLHTKGFRFMSKAFLLKPFMVLCHASLRTSMFLFFNHTFSDMNRLLRRLVKTLLFRGRG